MYGRLLSMRAERDSPLRIDDRGDEQDQCGHRRHRRDGPDAPPGHDPIERERLGLDLGLFFQGGDEARRHALGVDQLLGEPGVLDDGPDPLAELRESALDLGGGSPPGPPPQRHDDPAPEDRQRHGRHDEEPGRAHVPGQFQPVIGRSRRGQAERRGQERPAQALPDLVPPERCPDVLEASEELDVLGFGGREAHERSFHVTPPSGWRGSSPPGARR